MSTPSPLEVFERAHEYVRAYDLRFVDCFAADGACEFPFAPPGMPRRVVGREAIFGLLEPAYRAAREAGRRILGYENRRVHQSCDPEVIIVEFELVGAQAQERGGLLADDGRYRLAFIQVLRARDGEIVELRDYFDARAMADRLRASTALTAQASSQ